MIELKSREQLSRAIELAVKEKRNLLVQPTTEARKYRVLNRKKGLIYEVTFTVREDRKKFGHCTCRAGELGRECKHLAAAAGLHVCRAEQGLLSRQNQAT
jgi:hypothetical protein